MTYAGIAAGRFPRLAIDRTGIALLGAIGMVLVGALTPHEALEAVHVPTLLLLYGLMILSAQLRLGGFYTWLARRITEAIDRPGRFLFILMVVSGLLASVLANDIICLAFTPVLSVALRRRRLNPLPFLLGLAMATNLGSASTIIGNPQSMLIGQVARLSFVEFLLWCGPPSLLALLATYGLLVWLYRHRFEDPAGGDEFSEPEWPAFDRWQTTKGLAAALIVVGFLLTDLPREWCVIAVAGTLLMSRRMHTRSMLGLVDWHLITLFCGLFVIVRGFTGSGIPERVIADLAGRGLALRNPYVLSVTGLLLSNVVSNVPATMLLIPHMPADSPVHWYVLSLATTYAGNLLTIGSMANLIVIEQARPFGIRITLRDYARAGIPITAANLAILVVWIALRGGW